MGETVEVRLLNYPLDLYLRAQQHSDELIREFMHITNSRQSDPSAEVAPTRLWAIIDDLTVRFAAMIEAPRQERDAAIERGELRIDLTYVTPVEALEPVRQLGHLLDEADEYCRAGQHLLTLATPPDAVAFRRWFLGEFERQFAGEAPRPWPS